MKKTILILSGIIVLAFCSCSMKKAVDRLYWLKGTWSSGSDYEVWEKENSRELSGCAYYIRNDDTTYTETLKIVERNDSVFYIATVPDQNNGKPIEFYLRYTSNKKFVFYNPNHDFPQTIIYRKVDEDTFFIKITGIENGIKRFVSYTMRRVD